MIRTQLSRVLLVSIASPLGSQKPDIPRCIQEPARRVTVFVGKAIDFTSVAAFQRLLEPAPPAVPDELLIRGMAARMEADRDARQRDYSLETQLVATPPAV